jgi:hypothetical protein
MKTQLFKATLALLATSTFFAQEVKDVKKVTKTETLNVKEETNKRISYVIGVGSSYITNQLYQNPIVDQNNNVIIEKAQNLKTNVTFGIIYTPYFRNIYNGNGNDYDKITHGISFATFVNPIALSKTTNNQSFFNITDFGIGLGYKFAGNMMIMGTVEWSGVKQPKKWFINEFKNNDKPYLVNDSPQLSFDTNNTNVFETKIATTFGFKVCYTFDIVKNFQKGSETKADNTASK